MRCAIYVRVSTEEQRKYGISVDTQIEALSKYASDHGYSVVGVYNDAGHTARKSYKTRPAMLKLIQACESDQVDIIIFTFLDRWFRNLPDYYEVQKILDAHNVKWNAINEAYNTDTTDGIMMLNFKLTIAQAEADRTSDKIKFVMEQKRAKGEYVGSGHIQPGYKRENKGVVIDLSEKPAIDAFFKEYLSTFVIGKAIEKARENGLVLSRARARAMLTSPIYKGEIFNVKCEPYLTSDEWDLIQKSVNERRTRISPNKDKVNVFSGMLVCGICGRKLIAHSKRYTKGFKEPVVYKTYNCWQNGDHSNSVFEKKLEAQVLDMLEPALSEYVATARTTPEERADMSEEIKRLEAKKKRIGVRFEDGDITMAEYKSKREMIQLEIDKIKRKQSEDIQPPILPSNWRAVYESLDADHRRAFWERTIDHIVIYGGKDTLPEIVF